MTHTTKNVKPRGLHTNKRPCHQKVFIWLRLGLLQRGGSPDSDGGSSLTSRDLKIKPITEQNGSEAGSDDEAGSISGAKKRKVNTNVRSIPPKRKNEHASLSSVEVGSFSFTCTWSKTNYTYACFSGSSANHRTRFAFRLRSRARFLVHLRAAKTIPKGAPKVPFSYKGSIRNAVTRWALSQNKNAGDMYCLPGGEDPHPLGNTKANPIPVQTLISILVFSSPGDSSVPE